MVPAVDHRDALAAFAGGQPVVHAIPGEPRAEIGEVVGRVSAGQHVEHALEDAACELGERRGAPHRREERVEVPVVHGDHGDDLLRQDVERVAGVAARFDARLAHRPGDRGAGNQVAAIFRHDDAAAGRADGVSGAADALQPAGDRGRRLDLHDQIDRSHVDAELERGRGDEAANLSGLQAIFDLDALRPRQRPVMRADQHLTGELVQCRSQPLGDAPAVDEDQRRLMRPHQFEQPRMDRRPDRRARTGGGRRTARDVVGLAHLRHVLDGDFDGQVETLLLRRVDDRDRPVDDGVSGRREFVVDGLVWSLDRRVLLRLRSAGLLRGLLAASLARADDAFAAGAETPPRNRATSSSGRCVADSPIRCTPCAISSRRSSDSARCAPRLVGYERVDFVDDHRVDRSQRFARVRGEQQVDRFGRRDEDVGGIALKAGPLDRRRVAGADGNRRHSMRVATRRRAIGDAGQRRPQVAFDVDGERLERRQVEHAAARRTDCFAAPHAARADRRPRTTGPADPRTTRTRGPADQRHRLEHEPVDAPQEGGERLAAAGGRQDERRVSTRDRRPALRLRRRWRCKRRAEPVRHRRMK